MEIRKCEFNESEDDVGEVVLSLKRDCKCTCLCLARPELQVFLTEGGQQRYIGKVVDDWQCCNYQFSIYDAADQRRFAITGRACQLGLMCKCPCDPCNHVEFELTDGRDTTLTHITKTGAGFLKNSVSSTDNFSIPFPSTATWQDKSLLLGAALFIDYMMFEEKPSKNNNRH